MQPKFPLASTATKKKVPLLLAIEPSSLFLFFRNFWLDLPCGEKGSGVPEMFERLVFRSHI